MQIKEIKVRVEDKYVKWLSEINKNDVKEVGGKAANLGEMLKIGMPVPPGFVINSQGYSYFLQETGLDKEIYKKLEGLDVEDTELLEKRAKEIREMIIEKQMPYDLKDEILEAYGVLGIDKDALKTISKDVMNILKMREQEFVAVRSSATAEDSSEASFAGQQETFLNVKGDNELIDKVKRCFASLFTGRSIYYRVKKGFEHERVLNAVIIQIMINSSKSGVIFSKDPVTRKDNVVVEAVFGLGEGIVSGRIKPDNYIVSKELEILKENISDKNIALVRNSAGETEVVKLTEDRSKSKVLSDYEIKRLANYAIKLEGHYGIPQDIEFAIDSGEIFIVQTRPVTTLKTEIKEESVEGKEILSGLAASPGIGSGEVKIIKKLEELSKIKKGDVLVTKMTSPDMVVTMQKSSAIVTDEGGITAHASIVSREMGIPAVVGTKNATEILKDGMIVTVDGFNGKIYIGKPEELRAEKVVIEPVVQTETEIKVIIDLPSFAERASKTNVRGVGLTRIEGIIAESGKHPYGFSRAGEIEKYEEIIFRGIQKIADYFDELWIRTSDIRSDEFMNLEGAPKEKEGNPMLGMHGIRDGLKNLDILKAEVKAISRQEKKVGILLPQVISVEEVKKVKEILNQLGIKNLKLGVMIETPASTEIIEDLCDEGIDFVSFGTNDLTQYTLAIDRNNEEVQEIYDEMHPAVLSQIERVIRVCKKYNVETSICGQAGSRKEMAGFLVKLGIDSISVNADKAKEISEYVKSLEERGLRGSELKKDEPVPETLTVDNAPTSEPPELDDNTKYMEDKSKIIKQKPKYTESYDIICDECSKEAEVPFKPKPNLPVYCKECYLKKKNKKQEKLADEKVEEEVESEDKREEEFPDVDYGFDVFSQQDKVSEKEKHEAIEQEKKNMEDDAAVSVDREESGLEPDIDLDEQDKMMISVDGGKPEELEEEYKNEKEQGALEQLEEISEEIEKKVEKASQDLESNEEVLDIF